MTNVYIYSTNNLYNRITISDHSGYADAGEDIVCAGISILITTFENSLEELTNDKYAVMADEGDSPVIDIVIENPSEESQLLFKSLLVGLKLIKEEYNDYISLDYKEV